MWIKICANTSLEDARHAIRAGADAVGFVFAAESRRRVTPQQVAAITPRLPLSAEMIGVFVEQSGEEIVDIVRTAGLTGVQMHARDFGDGLESATRLREQLGNLPRRVMLIQVVHFDGEISDLQKKLALLSKASAVDAVLVDSHTADAAGGTGVTYDWMVARKALSEAVPKLRLIVAGGLTPQNVGTAVATLNPWGVDVASGVEASAGVKDAVKVESFILQARQADAEMGKKA